MPDSAECTINGSQALGEPRRARPSAMFFQLLTLDTLVPPNLRTTQLDSVW